jgi:hypothetical protein
VTFKIHCSECGILWRHFGSQAHNSSSKSGDWKNQMTRAELAGISPMPASWDAGKNRSWSMPSTVAAGDRQCYLIAMMEAHSLGYCHFSFWRSL